MFTSEPSLIQLIERMIADTPIIDPDTDLRPDRLSAPDLFAIMCEPVLVAELTAVGMTPADRDPGLSTDERMRRAIPYLSRIRNTAAAWCFYRILRDLFDFYDPNLTEANSRDLIDKVRQAGQDPAWGLGILRERCKIRKVVTGLENRVEGALGDSGFILYRLDVDRLFGRLTGRSERKVHESLDRGQAVSRISVNSAGSHPQVLDWHAEQGRTLQVEVGEGPIAFAFKDFGKTRFDILAGCDLDRKEAAALAARLPNVSISASWRHDFSAWAIADFVGRQVHGVPMSKLTGFSSGASCAEWTYGKLQMVKKAIASAFARLVESGYYEEDEIPPILRQILHDTPAELYRLS